MKKELGLLSFIGITFVAVSGTVLHFLYSFTSIFAFTFISSVNESTFEHMKILFFPMLIFSLLEYFYIGKNYQNYWCIKLKGILLGVFLIPTLFYTLTGFFGTLPGFINVIIFFVCIIVAFLFELKLLNEGSKNCKFNTLALITIILLGITFIVFTFTPPRLPLFLDPLTLTYGYAG